MEKKEVKTARERTQRLFKNTPRVRTQAPSKVEVIGLKDGEFEERKRKRTGRRGKKKK